MAQLSAYEQAMQDARNREAANTPGNWSGYQALQKRGAFKAPPQTINVGAIAQVLMGLLNRSKPASIPQQAKPSFDQQMAAKGWFRGSDGVYRQGATPSAMTAPRKGANYEELIRAAYQKLGGASPELMEQIPVMAKQIQQNPYLYPIYPAIPFAETSLGKNVPYKGNFFNWGVTMKPYPLATQTPNYITERVAYRLTTDPKYTKFRQTPTVESLQQSGYAPVDSNPHWLKNMQSALEAFPQL